MKKRSTKQEVLATNEGTKLTMSSVEIAERTGKRHADLMKSIRAMEVAWVKVNGGKFSLVEYIDSKGEKRPMYVLDHYECMYIATKFNEKPAQSLCCVGLNWKRKLAQRV